MVRAGRETITIILFFFSVFEKLTIVCFDKICPFLNGIGFLLFLKERKKERERERERKRERKEFNDRFQELKRGECMFVVLCPRSARTPRNVHFVTG